MPPIGANLPNDLSPVIATVYNDPQNNIIPVANNNTDRLKFVAWGWNACDTVLFWKYINC